MITTVLSFYHHSYSYNKYVDSNNDNTRTHKNTCNGDANSNDTEGNNDDINSDITNIVMIIMTFTKGIMAVISKLQ